MSWNERYVVDASGERIAVLIDLDAYRQLIDAAEELAAIRAFDEAQAAADEVILFEQAIAEIEHRR